MKFEAMNRKQQEAFLMPILVKILQNLGGEAQKKELIKELKESVNQIPEYIIEETKPRNKRDGTYRPFYFVLNFSITNLEMAGFLTRPQRGVLVLTQKGLTCNIDHLKNNLEQDVYAISNLAWKARSKINQAKTNISIPNEEFDEDDDSEIINSSEQWKAQLKQLLFSMPPQKFEIFCRALVKKMGVDIDESKGVSASRDGGLDGYGYITSDEFRTTRVAIQAKRWNDNTKIGTPEIDKFAGAMSYSNAEFGIFITTADFTRDGIERARSGQRPITLINGDKIIDLVEKYQLYIKPITTFQLESFYTEL